MNTVVLDSLEEIPELLANVQEDLELINYVAYLNKELDLLADLHKSFFDASAGPSGAPWAANAPSTIRQKGHAIVLRGKRGQVAKNVKATKRRPKVGFSRAKNIGGYRLATSLTAKSSQSHGDAIREATDEGNGAMLKFGTAVPYAIFNDQGTDRTPARPHIGMNDTHLDAMTNRVVDYAINELAGN